LIDDDLDDAEVAYERISSWLRCLVAVDDRMRRQLERDLAHPLYLQIRFPSTLFIIVVALHYDFYLGSSLSFRRTTNRGESLSSDELELIQRYKANEPFSIMVSFALSIILNRPYELVRDAWLGKVPPSSLLRCCVSYRLRKDLYWPFADAERSS
jgi:hypothetical protein